MADEITKKISIDVDINADGQQQINNYKTAFDSLRNTIAGLSNPLSNLSTSISSFDTDVTKLTASIDKLNSKNQETANICDKVKGKVTELISSFFDWKDKIDKLKLSLV